MKTRELQTLWWDWLSTAERLQRTLSEQMAALMLRDVAKVEKIQPELESLMNHMHDVDDRAVASARKLAESFGVEPSLRGLVGALETAEAQQVRGIANRVEAAARTVQEKLERNRKLVENELEYVNGTMALIAQAANESDRSYGGNRIESALVNQVA